MILTYGIKVTNFFWVSLEYFSRIRSCQQLRSEPHVSPERLRRMNSHGHEQRLLNQKEYAPIAIHMHLHQWKIFRQCLLYQPMDLESIRSSLTHVFLIFKENINQWKFEIICIQVMFFTFNMYWHLHKLFLQSVLCLLRLVSSHWCPSYLLCVNKGDAFV